MAASKSPSRSLERADPVLRLVRAWSRLVTGAMGDRLRREEDFRAVLQTSIDGFAMVGPDGRVIEANDALCLILRLPRERVVGRSLADLATHPSGSSLRFALRAPARVRLELRRLDGSELVAEVNARFLEPPGGRLATFVRDVTEEERIRGVLREAEAGRDEASAALRRTEEAGLLLQEQLLQAQKLEAVGRLAGGVAHDFNNLLTAIRGYADLLASELTADDPRREDALEIALAGQRAAALTRQLLLFSRRERPSLEPVDLSLAVGAVVPMLRRLIGEDVRLVTDLAPATARVDRGHLEQLVLNLAVNARDAMPRGGTLSLATAVMAAPGARGLRASLRVSDTGSGMTEEVRARLFEPFFTTKEAGKGTGLGLAIVRRIVEQLEGSIEVSTAPGAGATFLVLFPLVPAALEREPSPHPTPPPRRASGSVLVVEDEDAVRRLICRVLEERGYAVIEAADGAEAIRLCQCHPAPIDAVLTDLVLPDMSGGDVNRAARRLRPAVRVLFMSGYPEDLAARQELEPHAPFLAKPFTPKMLERAIAELLAAG